MSAAAVFPPQPPHTRVERRCRQTPWGIKIETWRLVETRTLPVESARLPFSLLFEETASDGLGAIPCSTSDDAVTLEAPVDDDVTSESPAPVHETTKAGAES